MHKSLCQFYTNGYRQFYINDYRLAKIGNRLA